jgi:hypothetical protein
MFVQCQNSCSRPLFISRQTYVSVNVAGLIEKGEIVLALERHRNGDWADCSDEQKEFNQRHLSQKQGLVFSCFRIRATIPFYVVTDLARFVTSVRRDHGL